MSVDFKQSSRFYWMEVVTENHELVPRVIFVQSRLGYAFDSKQFSHICLEGRRNLLAEDYFAKTEILVPYKVTVRKNVSSSLRVVRYTKKPLRLSVLQIAIIRENAHEIFNTDIWRGRLPELMAFGKRLKAELEKSDLPQISDKAKEKMLQDYKQFLERMLILEKKKNPTLKND